MVRPRSPLFTDVAINLDFAGVYSHLCLPLFGVVRYDPAPLLGHVLGHRRRRWRGKSIG